MSRKFVFKLFLYALFGFLVGYALLGYGLFKEPAIGHSSGAYNYGLFQLETLLTSTCLFLVLGILREGGHYIRDLKAKRRPSL